MRLGSAKPQAVVNSEWKSLEELDSRVTSQEVLPAILGNSGVEVRLHFKSGLVLTVPDVTGAVAIAGRQGVVELDRGDGQVLAVDLREVVAYSLSHRASWIARALAAAWRAK